MGCFSCFKSSKGSKKSWKCWKGKASNGDDTLKKRKRRGICLSSKKKGCFCCFICGKSSKDEEPSRQKRKCGTGCFCCNGSSKVKDSSTKGTKSGMCNFKRTKNSSKEPSTRKGKGCISCFCCCKPSKEEELKSGKEKDTSCCTCFNSSERTGCFRCFKPSTKEPSARKRKGCMSCFCCCKPSKEEELRLAKEKDTSCCTCFNSSSRTGCFHCFKSSTKEPSTRKGKGCMSCFCCCKPSKEEELRMGKEKGTSCCACFHLSHRTGCFRCFKSSKRKDRAKITPQGVTESSKQRPPTQEIIRIGNDNIAARVFTYRKLSESTQNFSPECLLGEGGLGKVYKGHLKDTNETITVKKLNRNESQENREFLIEVLMLSLLSHPNLVSLLGYCAEGDERFLVYHYMPLGSLQEHLLDLSPNSKPLDWKTRMKIAVGAAKGLEHLHDKANPPVIFRNLKASNILLDEDYNARLADFGLDKFGPVRDTNHISTRVMGTYGYCAPEYALTGKLTVMSDIYSFGVVLLELITGRKAMDSTRPLNEQRLVDWAMPRFKNKKNFVHMADPSLEGNFPEKDLYQALAVAAMCVQEEDTTRPLIKDVVNTLQYLAMEMPGKSMDETENHKEQHSEESIDPSNTDDESLHSSDSDWQSCPTAREDEEEIEQEDIVS